MKRITFWLLATVSVVVLLFGYDASRTGATSTLASPPAAVATGPQGSSSGSGGSGATPSPSSGGSAGSSAGGSSGKARSTTTKKVTGGVADTQWGPVQVQLALRAGKITKVKVLQQPSGNSMDTQINAYALPILVQETTAAQSAQIDMVTGATVTSTGYLQSLQSALDAAHL